METHRHSTVDNVHYQKTLLRRSKPHCKGVHVDIKRSHMGDNSPIFNQSILFNSRIKLIYKNKLNKNQ